MAFGNDRIRGTRQGNVVGFEQNIPTLSAIISVENDLTRCEDNAGCAIYDEVTAVIDGDVIPERHCPGGIDDQITIDHHISIKRDISGFKDCQTRQWIDISHFA